MKFHLIIFSFSIPFFRTFFAIAIGFVFNENYPLQCRTDQRTHTHISTVFASTSSSNVLLFIYRTFQTTENDLFGLLELRKLYFTYSEMSQFTGT